jgi:hypothetical protein
MLPKWPKGSDCKSDCFAFGGSNPSHATENCPVIPVIMGYFCSIRAQAPTKTPQLILHE